MRPNTNEYRIVYLHPGEIVYSRFPVMVSTVLGSCLSITMFSAVKKFGAISHCQLPDCGRSKLSCKECPEPYKYVNCTFERMIEKFGEQGIDSCDIEVKIFGGADVLKSVNKTRTSQTVGTQNVNAALNYIRLHSLNLVKSDVGGINGRRIFFLTSTGEIYLTRLNNYGKD